MMDVAIAQTEKLRTYENSKIEYVLFQRYLLRYMIGKDKDDIIKAKKIIVKLNREYEKNAKLQLMLSLAYAVNGELIETTKIIEDVNVYRSYYKKNEKDVYKLLLFVEIITTNSVEKRVEEKIRELLLYKDKEAYTYLACIYVNMENWKSCYEYINFAFEANCTSPFLYYCLYEYFGLRELVEDNNKMLFRLISWCIKNEVPYRSLVKNQYKKILEQLPENIEVSIQIYRDIQSNVLLGDIVNCLILSNAKMCPEYFELYVIANNKQLKVDGLNNELVKGASMYGYDDISNYTMKNFLATKNMTSKEKRYVYHMLVTNDKLQNLIPGHENDIYTTCIASIGEKNIDRQVLSLYKYVIENLNKYTISELYTKQIEDVAYNNLFLNEITVENENATHVIIKQKLVKKLAKYQLINKKAIVDVVDDDCTVIVVDDSCSCVIESEYNMLARVCGDKTKLCNHFYKKDRINNDILLNIATNYVKYDEVMYDSAIDNLNKFIELVDDEYISENANNKLCMYIGNCYSSVQDYNNALKFYEQITYDNGITVSNKVITSYINTKNYDSLLLVVVNKYKELDVNVLTKAMKTLIESGFHCDELSQVSYYLIQNNVEDSKIYDNFGMYYEGEIREYKEVYEKIYDKTNINENIVNRTIMGRKLTTESKNIVMFLETVIEAYMKSDGKSIKELCYYLSYEMIINDYVPTMDIIQSLEKREMLVEEEEIAIGLSKIYVNNGIKTKNSNRILQKAIDVCKEKYIMFPFIKWQNLITDTEYVKKYTPFVYYGDKDDNVSMQYKKDDEFFVVDMDYYKFGIHITMLNLFYNEEVEYQYIVNRKDSDLVKTERQHIINTNMSIVDVKDSFFLVNNALIYNDMHKYDEVIKIINNIEENVNDYKLF